MLRLLVLLLLLANAAWFAWAQGLLQPWGYAPAQQSEPQRMAQQVRPEAVRLLGRDEAQRPDPPAKGPECLQSSLLDEAAGKAVRQALANWPAAAWQLEPVVEPGRWIIYMGRYASAEDVSRKQDQLRQIGVRFDPVGNPELQPGLSLGNYATQPEAAQALDRLAQRGVRTARVIQERPDARGLRLTLPALDDALRARLDELKPPLGGRALAACR